jgi:RNA recognition motif-containing protein
VPCDTLSGNATGEQQASEDDATATYSDACGSDLTTSMSNNSTMTSATTCSDDALTDTDVAPSSRAPEAADDKVTRLDRGRASNSFVPSPSSPAPPGPHGKTMMLRNIPCRVTQEELEEVIRQMGFGGRCNFVYVPPSHRPQSNIGYAFVNLIDEASADAFKLDFDGFRFPGKLSKKVCEVQPARLQGRVAQLSQRRKAPLGCPSP